MSTETVSLKKIREDVAKAFGGCTKCYGKGYNTQGHAGKTQLNFCSCDRGKQILALTGEIQDRTEAEFLKYAKSILPDYIEDEYPKGKTKERGAATVHIAGFLVHLKNCL